MSIELFIHNTAFIVAAVLMTGLAISVFVTGVNRRQAILLTLSCISIAGFTISHVFGVNVTDSILSRRILMFNLSDIFIAMFMYHWAVTMLGDERRHRGALIAVYGSGFAIFAAAVIFPAMFLQESTAKLYFPNYYEPGPIYGFMVAYFFATTTHLLYRLSVSFYRAHEFQFRNRLKYVLTGLIVAYIFGPLAFLLVYDIPVNPAWSPLLAVLPFFFAYAMAQYELLDIRIVAKKAAVYAGGVAVATLFLSLVNFGIIILFDQFPRLSLWYIPFILFFVSTLAFLVGRFVWKKLREGDILKHEFVNVVTHKFGTPLTHVKWALTSFAEEAAAENNEERKTQVQDAKKSVDTLIKLTHLLAGLSHTGIGQSSTQAIDVSKLVKKIRDAHSSRIEAKNLTVTMDVPADVVVRVNADQFTTVLNILMDNAVTYTEKGDSVTVSAVRRGDNVKMVFVDTGIGIDPENLPLIGTRFFRTDNATKTDTEGMGVGLYVVDKILDQQGGSFDIDSEGVGEGTIVTLTLPGGTLAELPDELADE